MSTTLSALDRHALVDADVTLNGNPAAIGGVQEPFATVTDLTTGLSATWAWGTVARIVEDGGMFRS